MSQLEQGFTGYRRGMPKNRPRVVHSNLQPATSSIRRYIPTKLNVGQQRLAFLLKVLSIPLLLVLPKFKTKNHMQTCPDWYWCRLLCMDGKYFEVPGIYQVPGTSVHIYQGICVPITWTAGFGRGKLTFIFLFILFSPESLPISREQ